MHLWSSSFHTMTGISIAGNIYRVISKWTAHYPICPASLDTNAQTKTVYGSSPIVVCSWEQAAQRYRLRKHEARRKGVSNQRQSSWQPSTRKDCISSAFRWCPPPCGSFAQRSQCSIICISSIMRINMCTGIKKNIVNIVKSSVKHNKTYWSKLWFRSDTHLILLWY